MHQIRLVHTSTLPLAELFDRLADHNRLQAVFGIPVRRIRDGQGDPNGVGSVRRLGVGPLAVEETVTGLEPQRSIDYRITRGGFPLREHRGHLQFEPLAVGSRVEWSIQFESALPLAGTALKLLLTLAIGQGLKRLG
ncbi:MAG TPA: SRPBCC family protein [Nevskiaceae bacterium]|nr:SRPBCC family protein [Nevskiaceae bacterium]